MARRLGIDDLSRLLAALQGEGYQLVGPTEHNGAIIYDDISGVDDLPKGRTDRQEP